MVYLNFWCIKSVFFKRYLLIGHLILVADRQYVNGNSTAFPFSVLIFLCVKGLFFIVPNHSWNLQRPLLDEEVHTRGGRQYQQDNYNRNNYGRSVHTAFGDAMLRMDTAELPLIIGHTFAYQVLVFFWFSAGATIFAAADFRRGSLLFYGGVTDDIRLYLLRGGGRVWAGAAMPVRNYQTQVGTLGVSASVPHRSVVFQVVVNWKEKQVRLKMY